MDTTEETSIHELFEKIKDIKMCMLTTHVIPEGIMRSRPMATLKAEEETSFIYFFTNDVSAKVEEIDSEQQVCLSYMDMSKELYISVSGTANFSYDKEKMKQLWNPMLKAWFPEGIEDPNLAIIKIKPSQAEYWDAPDNKMNQLFGMARAIVTGSEYNEGENKKINL